MPTRHPPLHRCTTCPTTRPACVMPVGATQAGTASVCVTQWLPMPRPVWTRVCVWTGGPQTSAVSVSPHPQTCLPQKPSPGRHQAVPLQDNLGSPAIPQALPSQIHQEEASNRPQALHPGTKALVPADGHPSSQPSTVTSTTPTHWWVRMNISMLRRPTARGTTSPVSALAA